MRGAQAALVAGSAERLPHTGCSANLCYVLDHATMPPQDGPIPFGFKRIVGNNQLKFIVLLEVLFWNVSPQGTCLCPVSSVFSDSIQPNKSKHFCC